MENDTVNRILKAGEEMRDKYCTKRERTLMFPLAPCSKNIDKFPENIESPREQKEYDQQIQYEGEVKVYKVLENQKKGLIVCHGFRCTHKQYSLFVRGHSNDCKKKDQEEEGECDFLVLQDSFLAVLEVKVPNLDTKDPNKTCKRAYKDSINQRERKKTLIFGICKRMKVTAPKVLDFTVFSNGDKSIISKFPFYEKLLPKEKECILFMNDLEEPNSNLSQRLQAGQESSVHERLKFILLGLWYYDDINDRTNLKNVDLSETIKDLDCQLRISKISRVRINQQPVSSFVVRAPINLQKLNIKFITKSQKSVLTNEEKKLWINGPAGSGKTLLIMGKVVDLLKDPHGKLVIVVLNKTVAKYYQQHLETANVSSVLYEYVNEALLEIETHPTVFIVYYKGDFVNGAIIINEFYRLESITAILKTDYHVFLDDFHGLTAGMDYNPTKDLYNIVFTELNSNSPRLFWVTYDILQDGFITQYLRTSFRMREVVNNVKNKDCFQCLPNVLRNSRQIADLLSSIRTMRLENEKQILSEYQDERESDSIHVDHIPTDEEFKTFFSYMSLEQEIGHYIHGPKPVLYNLQSNWSNTAVITAKAREILAAELLKLGSGNVAIVVDRNIITIEKKHKVISMGGPSYCSKGIISSNHIEPEHSDDAINWKEECEKVLSSLDSSSSNKLNVSVHNIDETFSAEWPAVIGIVEFSRRMFCPQNALFFSSGRVISNAEDMMDQLLSKLYITVSRARTYCCLIFIMRDFDIYIDWKRKTSGLKKRYREDKLVSDQVKRTKDEFISSFSNIFETFNNHMTVEGTYSCRSEIDDKMHSS